MIEQTDFAGSMVFKPRHEFSLTLIPAMVTLIFTVSGIAAALATGDTVVLLLPVIGFFFYGLVLLTTAAPGYSYRIEKNELVLKNTFTQRRINLKDIAAAYLFTGEQAQAYLTELETPWADATRSRDFSLWSRSVKRNTEILRFMSVPLVTSSRSVGSKTNITRFKVLARGEYLLIRTSDNAVRMITPKDTEGLYRRIIAAGAVEGNAEKIITSEKEYAKGREEERKDKFPKSFVRVYRIVAFGIAAFIVIVTFIGLIHPPEGTAAQNQTPAAEAMTAEPSETASPAEEAFPEPGWVDGNTLLVRVDSMYWPAEDQPVETRISLMREFGDLEAQSAFARFIAEEYAQKRALTPADTQWDQLLMALKDWAGELPKERIHEDLGERLRFGKFVYRFTAPNLKEEAETRIAGFEN